MVVLVVVVFGVVVVVVVGVVVGVVVVVVVVVVVGGSVTENLNRKPHELVCSCIRFTGDTLQNLSWFCVF